MLSVTLKNITINRMDEINNNHNKFFLSHNSIRLILLVVISIDIIMVIISTFMYPPLLTMPHFYTYILELGVMLPLYIAIVLWATRPSTVLTTLRIAAFFGLMAGLLEIVHISIEDFGHMNAHAETVSTGIFMGGLFLLFAVSGYCITLNRRNVISGMLGASWSAVVCMLIVMTYGLSQLFWSFGAIENHDIGDPDFIRTGWTDMHAFVIADIFEACFKILLLGPIVGLVFGLFGAVIAYFFIARKVQV
jgi:hypothetical protein